MSFPKTIANFILEASAPCSKCVTAFLKNVTKKFGPQELPNRHYLYNLDFGYPIEISKF